MKKKLPAIRSAAWGMMVLPILLMFASLGPGFDTSCNLFGLLGLGVLLLTIAIAESRIRKAFFLFAGFAGTAAWIT